MNYDDFKAAFQAALAESGLPVMGLAEEKLDLRSLDRIYGVVVEPIGGQDLEPFQVTATIRWHWRALQTARTVTSEQDVVQLLFGQQGKVRKGKVRRLVPDKPILRVDIMLYASRAWGAAIPLPAPALWRSWAHEVMTRLDKMERVVPAQLTRRTAGGGVVVVGWHGEPVAEVGVAPDGSLTLLAVVLNALQTLEVPRALDESEHEDEHPHRQLGEMFGRVRSALHAWKESLDHLLP